MSDTEPLDTSAITAAELDGREHPLRPSAEEQQRWKDAGLFVIFGASDDLVEICGVDREAQGAPGSFLLGRYGPCRPWSEARDEIDDWASDDQVVAVIDPWLAARRTAVKIESFWCPPSGESWLITAAGGIGHHFNVMEDGEVFCRALVLSVDDLPQITGEEGGGS